MILAGGKSLRLGQDKVLYTFGNKSLLEHVISRVSQLSKDIIVVISEKRSIPQIKDYPKLKIVTDFYPARGPLVGIYTGLTASATFYNLVVASDMPFLNRALLTYMIQIADGFDVVVPRIVRLVEPLHAVYARSCLAPIEDMLNKDDLSVYKLLNLVKVRYVEAEEIERFDPEHLSLFNINTKDDLEKARELATKGY